MFLRETSKWQKASARRTDFEEEGGRMKDENSPDVFIPHPSDLILFYSDAIVRESHPLPLSGRKRTASKQFTLKEQVADYCFSLT